MVIPSTPTKRCLIATSTGDEPCFMSVEGAAALGSDYASLDGLYGAISCHDGRPLYSNIAGDGTGDTKQCAMAVAGTMPRSAHKAPSIVNLCHMQLNC